MKLLNTLKLECFRLSFALVACFLAVPAFAQTDVGTTVSTAIAAANPQIVLVIGAMAAALVIIVVWQLVKRAMGR